MIKLLKKSGALLIWLLIYIPSSLFVVMVFLKNITFRKENK